MNENYNEISGNFLFFNEQTELESSVIIPAQVYKQMNKKLKLLDKMKQENLKQILPKLPEKGISYHIISNGKFDFFSFIPAITEMLNNNVDEYYGSTWTMNRSNVVTILDLFDQKIVKKINILTGLYFKRRESAVYSLLLNGLIERKQKYKSLKNHSKISLLANKETDDYITIEGSANYTANPRIEQYVINNDKGLYDFHKNWMDKILDE